MYILLLLCVSEVVWGQECGYGTAYQGQCECWTGYKGATCDIYDRSLMPSADSGVGMNLGGVNYWMTEWAFVDVMQHADWWVTQRTNGSGSGEWDTGEHGLITWRSDGYPDFLPESNLIIGALMLRDDPHMPSGRFLVLYEGQGSLEFDFAASVINEEPGRIEIDVEANNTDGIFFKIMYTSPADPIRNVRIIMPGFENRYEQFPFHPLYLQSLSRYSVLRFMDWGLTNNHPEDITWENRRPVEFYTEGHGPVQRGVSYEHMIHLCNVLGAHMWVCVPHAADDAYVQSLAELIHDNIRPDLRVYVEYSNEVWNSQFTQHDYAAQKGVELGFTDPDTPWEGAWYYTAYRSTQIFAIFEQVFGPDQRSRLEFILPTQAANPYVTEQIVTFQNASQYADSIAWAAYFCGYLGHSDMHDWSLAASVDDMFDNCTNSFPGEMNMYRDHLDIAREHGLHTITYEAGQHLVRVGSTGDPDSDSALDDKFMAMNRHDRMLATQADFMTQYKTTVVQDSVNANGGGLWGQFSSAYTPGQYGSWGVIEYTEQDRYTAPKYQALHTYINENATNAEGVRCSFVALPSRAYGCYRKGAESAYGCYSSPDSGATWQDLPPFPPDVTYSYLTAAGASASHTLYVRATDALHVDTYLVLPERQSEWIKMSGEVFFSQLADTGILALPPGVYNGLDTEAYNCP